MSFTPSRKERRTTLKMKGLFVCLFVSNAGIFFSRDLFSRSTCYVFQGSAQTFLVYRVSMPSCLRSSLRFRLLKQDLTSELSELRSFELEASLGEETKWAKKTFIIQHLQRGA